MLDIPGAVVAFRHVAVVIGGIGNHRLGLAGQHLQAAAAHTGSAAKLREDMLKHVEAGRGNATKIWENELRHVEAC